MQPRNHPSAAISPKQALRRIPKIAGAYWRAAPGEASPSEAQPPRLETGNNVCPAARVKRAYPEGLPASPVFSWLSGLPIRKPTVYGRFRPVCLQSLYLRGFPAGLPAGVRVWRPQFLWAPGKMRQHTQIIFWDRYQMIFMD